MDICAFFEGKVNLVAIAAELVLGVEIQHSHDVRLRNKLLESQAYDFGQFLLGLDSRDWLGVVVGLKFFFVEILVKCCDLLTCVNSLILVMVCLAGRQYFCLFSISNIRKYSGS